MGTRGHWMRFLAVAAGYAVAFFLFQQAMPFSLGSPWFVCVAMVCLLGLAFEARPVVSIRMPRSLRRIRTREVEGGIYRTLGVPTFGRLLRRTPLTLLNAYPVMHLRLTRYRLDRLVSKKSPQRHGIY